MSTKRPAKQPVAKRDPYASSLTKPQYRQQRLPDNRHRKRLKVERREIDTDRDE